MLSLPVLSAAISISIAISHFLLFVFFGKLINRRNSIWKVGQRENEGISSPPIIPLESDNTNRQQPTANNYQQPAVSDKSNKRVTVERA